MSSLQYNSFTPHVGEDGRKIVLRADGAAGWISLGFATYHWGTLPDFEITLFVDRSKVLAHLNDMRAQIDAAINAAVLIEAMPQEISIEEAEARSDEPLF